MPRGVRHRHTAAVLPGRELQEAVGDPQVCHSLLSEYQYCCCSCHVMSCHVMSCHVNCRYYADFTVLMIDSDYILDVDSDSEKSVIVTCHSFILNLNRCYLLSLIQFLLPFPPSSSLLLPSPFFPFFPSPSFSYPRWQGGVVAGFDDKECSRRFGEGARGIQTVRVRSR